MKPRILLTLLLLLTAVPATLAGANQADFAPETPDSTASGANKPVFAPAGPKEPAPLTIQPCEAFHARQLIAPGVLLAGGVTGVYSQWYKEKVNIPIRGYAQELSGGQRLHFDDWIQYAPVVTFAGLGFGVRSDHDFAERLCITATAYAVQGILTNAIKYTVREQRPDSEARNSFPSGHSATAFMGAELVRREYGGWWGAGAYAVAATTALMRVYNDRHWSNDLLGGAAIGILSADIGFWLMPLERRWFHLDGTRRSRSGADDGSRACNGSRPGVSALTILPTPYGLCVACVF